MSKIRTLIVDDVPMARERVLSLLRQETDVEVIGECADGPEAVSVIQQQPPDLVFPDVQMPGCNGFDVIFQRPRREDDELVGDIHLAVEPLGHKTIEGDDGPRPTQDLPIEPIEDPHLQGSGRGLGELDHLVRVQIHHPIGDRRAAKHVQNYRRQRAHGWRRAHHDLFKVSQEQTVQDTLQGK